MEGKKTKEKTRVLAHSRRQKENDTFVDIAEALPLQGGAKDLDKASLLRVAIHYLKLRRVLHEDEHLHDGEAVLQGESDCGDGYPSSERDANISSVLPNFSRDMIQALDGFLLVISREGRLLYVSESIAQYLGLKQVAVIGSHIQDIVHPQDYGELATILHTQGRDTEQVFDPCNPQRRNFVMRMRCAFTPSVQSITRCSNFKPVYCSMFLKFSSSGELLGITSLCKLASISKIKEMCVGTFIKTKHALDMSFTVIDSRIRWILGYDPAEMVGLKVYQYLHPEDMTQETLSKCHANLLIKGRSQSPCFRLLSRWGDWVWVKSRSYVTYSPSTHLPDGVVVYTWIIRVDEEEMKAHVAQRTKLCEEERVEATKLLHGSCAENSEKENLSEDKLKSESLSSNGDAYQKDESAQKEPTPPQEQPYHILPEILTSSQANKFQEPQTQLFEYMPTDQFSIEDALESLDSSDGVPTPGSSPGDTKQTSNKLAQHYTTPALQHFAAYPSHPNMAYECRAEMEGNYSGVSTMVPFGFDVGASYQPRWREDIGFTNPFGGNQQPANLSSFLGVHNHAAGPGLKVPSTGNHLLSSDLEYLDSMTDGSSEGSSPATQYGSSLDIFTSSATEILGPITSDGGFFDSDLSAYQEMVGPNLTDLKLLDEEPPLHYEPPSSPAAYTAHSYPTLPAGYVAQARTRYTTIASAIGESDRLNRSTKTIHGSHWQGWKLNGASAPVH